MLLTQEREKGFFLKHLHLYKILLVFLSVFLLLGPLGIVHARLQDGCFQKTKDLGVSVVSSQPHACCCGETRSCCCDVKQDSQATFPDMALVAVSGAEHPSAPRGVTSDVDPSFPPLPQILTSLGRWMGTGPPFDSSYLVNLTLRC